MPRKRLNCSMSGMVASPTPMMPISSDSTSVSETSSGFNTRDSAAAVIHPAAPPPTITICRKLLTAGIPRAPDRHADGGHLVHGTRDEQRLAIAPGERVVGRATTRGDLQDVVAVGIERQHAFAV